MSSSEILQGKPLQAREGEKCVEYSLVTTFYFTDGTTIEYSTYLFTSCSGPGGSPSDCPPGAANCDGGMFEGGGGGGSWDDDDEEEKTAEKSMEFSNYGVGGEHLLFYTKLNASGMVYANSASNYFCTINNIDHTISILNFIPYYDQHPPRIASQTNSNQMENASRSIRISSRVIVNYFGTSNGLAPITGVTHFHASSFF